MPRNQGLAVEMTLRGRKSVILTARSSRCPRSLETRTERGFPHFHSNGCGGGPNLPKLQNPPKSQGLTGSCAEAKLDTSQLQEEPVGIRWAFSDAHCGVRPTLTSRIWFRAFPNV